MRRQIFRQIVSKRRRNTSVFQGVLGQYDEKDASRCAAKATAANCSVLPLYYSCMPKEKPPLILSKAADIL